MIELLLKQIITYKTQIFFCLLGIFLARETYFQIIFPFAFDNDGIPLSLMLRLKLALLASLFWLPMILALPLFQMPLMIRRLFALIQLPAFIALLVVLLLLLLDLLKAFNGNLSIYPDQISWLIIGFLTVLSLVITVGYFEIQLFFMPKNRLKLK